MSIMIPLPLEVFPPLNAADLGAPPWDPLPLIASQPAPPHCDIVIVGAGITGLSAALACSAAGRHVVVLERALGTGATARSGGVVLGDTVEGPAPEFSGCETTLRNWIERLGADCDLRWPGCFELARDERLPSSPIHWNDHGAVRIAGRVNGGVLNPVKLQAALIDSARAAGVTIVDRATVSNIERADGMVQVSFNGDSMFAGAGLMAVDAMCWRPGFDPWWERAMTVSLQTASLSEGTLTALGLQRDVAFYTTDLPLLWGRVMPNLSLLIGRETQPFPRRAGTGIPGNGLAEARTRLAKRLRGLHPALADAPIQNIWSGPLARTTAGRPTIAIDPFVPALLWAGGYGGQGIAQGFRLGQLAAETMLRSESRP